MIYTQAVNVSYSHSMDALLLYHLSLSSLHLSSVGTLAISIPLYIAFLSVLGFQLKDQNCVHLLSVLLISTGVVVSDG